MMHGAIYVVMKTEGELQETAPRLDQPHCIIFFIICYAVTTMATLLYVPHMAGTRPRQPLAVRRGAALNMLAIANIPREIHRGRDFRAFLSSCAAMVAADGAVRPRDVPAPGARATPTRRNSLTIYNAASSQKTLSIMLIIALIGVPDRAGLHGQHLLDLPRQGEAGPDELLNRCGLGRPERPLPESGMSKPTNTQPSTVNAQGFEAGPLEVRR